MNRINRLMSEYKKEINISKSDISRAFGVSRMAVSNWASGLTNPSRTKMFNESESDQLGWKKDFALDVLGILDDDKEPVTRMGKLAISDVKKGSNK